MINTYNYKNQFIETANDDFILSDETDVYNPEVIRNFVQRHKLEQLPRLEYLEAYYLNRNVDVLTANRRLDSNQNKADHRATHNFAKYVSQFIVGYLTGNPISITHEDDRTQNAITELNDKNDGDAINSDLALNLSIYGRAYEIVYRNEDNKDRFLSLDPKNTFVIYNSKVDRKVIAGVRYQSYQDKNGERVDTAEVYTDKQHNSYELRDGNYVSVKERQHFYKEPQIIEYLNDKFKQGDYENVISLIDLYDSAQSDTANYMTDLNDAMLVLVGNMNIDGDDALKFRQANMMHLEPSVNGNGGEGKADAKFIYKQYDVAGAEANKTRLANDIHKFTNTPDMNDEKFGGTQSGESMKYKLFGLEQKRATKERYFKKGLMKRYRLLLRNQQLENTYSHDVDDIKITFVPNLPKALKESVELFNMLGEGVSQETRLSVLDIVDNPKEEIKRMEKEEEEVLNRTGQNYTDPFTKVADNNAE